MRKSVNGLALSWNVIANGTRERWKTRLTEKRCMPVIVKHDVSTQRDDGLMTEFIVRLNVDSLSANHVRFAETISAKLITTITRSR